MSFASIIIDNETAPGGKTVEVVANAGKQLATFGVDGKSKGTINPDYGDGRIVVGHGGTYRVELFMCAEVSVAGLLRAHIARNGGNTHVGVYVDFPTTAESKSLSCADYIQLDGGDSISVNLVLNQTAVITVNEAQLIVTEV